MGCSSWIRGREGRNSGARKGASSPRKVKVCGVARVGKTGLARKNENAVFSILSPLLAVADPATVADAGVRSGRTGHAPLPAGEGGVRARQPREASDRRRHRGAA